MRKARRGWTMPEEDARSMLSMIEERIRSSHIRVEHRDALIRLRAMIEDDLAAREQGRSSAMGSEGPESGRTIYGCVPQPRCYENRMRTVRLQPG